MKRAYFGYWLTVWLACLLAACGSINPLARAETLGQKTYALYGEFVIAEEQAAKLFQDPVVPANIKAALSTADRAAKPAADSLLAAILEVDSVRAQLAAGTTTDEKLTIAVANLNQWYTTARPLILSLKGAVGDARK